MGSSPQGYACPTGCAQTGKCPTSGGFFAVLLALVGGFCPEKAIRFERLKRLTTLFSIIPSLPSVRTSFLHFVAFFRPRPGDFEASSRALWRRSPWVNYSRLS